MRRRILAITLLIAFGAPLVAPLFAATVDPQASLPACCRSNGAHHCAMMHMASSGPAFQAPPCPFYPGAYTAPPSATASLVAPLPPSVEIRRSSAPLIPSLRCTAGKFSASANLKRGPPTQLA